jgi:hypothetical protein
MKSASPPIVLPDPAPMKAPVALTAFVSPATIAANAPPSFTRFLKPEPTNEDFASSALSVPETIEANSA